MVCLLHRAIEFKTRVTSSRTDDIISYAVLDDVMCFVKPSTPRGQLAERSPLGYMSPAIITTNCWGSLPACIRAPLGKALCVEGDGSEGERIICPRLSPSIPVPVMTEGILMASFHENYKDYSGLSGGATMATKTHLPRTICITNALHGSSHSLFWEQSFAFSHQRASERRKGNDQ